METLVLFMVLPIIIPLLIIYLIIIYFLSSGRRRGPRKYQPHYDRIYANLENHESETLEETED